MESNNIVIIPYRNIPFDIGCSINSNLKNEFINHLLSKEHAVQLEIDSLLKTLSDDIICVFQLRSKIRLYLYKYGIGVFAVEDGVNQFDSHNYAVEYCQKRKKAHEEFLTIENRISKYIYRIAESLRSIAVLNGSSLRISASNTWENNGFSYVMTVSCVNTSSLNYMYKNMNDTEKKNLHIMLEPSIAHAEDSLVYSTTANSEMADIEVDLATMEEPFDWIRSSDFSIYISWAAVLLYTANPEKMTFSALEFLEVDLQAMWLYTYCLYENLKNYNSSHKILVSKLRKDLYKFKRKYNEFKSVDDTSAPAYITRLRDELIRTSGINAYANKYIEYIEFCITETESINAEKQKKYSWLNEILLFIIAFIQIAPMIYELMTGGCKDIQLMPIIIMVIFVIIAIVIIILKD